MHVISLQSYCFRNIPAKGTQIKELPICILTPSPHPPMHAKLYHFFKYYMAFLGYLGLLYKVKLQKQLRNRCKNITFLASSIGP